MPNDETPEQTDCTLSREEWAAALMHLSSAENEGRQDEGAARAEVRQMLIDAMDVTEQTPLGDDIHRALNALDGKPTGAQEAFRSDAEQERDRLHEAVTIFLRQHMRPDEESRVFPISAVKALEAAVGSR